MAVTDQPGVYSGTLDPGDTYGKCFLDVSYASFDTPDDPDELPEKRVPTSAKLTVAPNVAGALIGDNSSIVIVTPTTLTADTNGHFEFYCIDGNHSSLNPNGWNWSARLTVDGTAIGTFNFSPDSTSDDPINIGQFFPITDPTTGQAIQVGPPGPAPTVSWDGDQLVVNGVTGPHLTGPGGSGGGVSDYNDLTNKPDLSVYVPKTTTVNSKALNANITLVASDVGALTQDMADSRYATFAQGALATNAVPNTRTVNGHALSADATLTASDVGALTQATADGRYATAAQGTLATNAVPNTRTVNGKALNANISLAAADISAVPTTTSVNGQALSANITLAAADVGAVPQVVGSGASAVRFVGYGPTLPSTATPGDVFFLQASS